MYLRHHLSGRLLSILSFVVLCAVLLAACGSSATSNAASSTGSLKSVSIGLGYTPDIQFAPFYVAQSKGYYKAAGLNVTLHHGIETDLIGTMLAGKSTFVFASGDELLVAHDKNKDVKIINVGTIYQEYPVSLIVPAASAIKTLADLKGHSIGVPGPYGATYIGLLALLYKANLPLSDVHVESIGFNQVAALAAHRVDAVMGYANNEPLQLEHDGVPVRTFLASDYQPLVSNGIITTQQMYSSQPQVVRSFVQATLRGVRDVLNDPRGAVTISQSYVPALNTTQALAELDATLPVYRGDGRLGYNDSATWESMAQFLVAQKLIAPVTNLAQFYTNQDIS